MIPFTPDDRAAAIAYILQGVAGGRGVKRILREDTGCEGVPRLPSNAVFWSWHFQDRDLQDLLVRAREAGVEAIVDEIVAIADGDDENPSEDANMRRVRILAREKAAQMLKPRKYGPKLDVTSGGQTLGLAETMAIARQRVIEHQRQGAEHDDEHDNA